MHARKRRVTVTLSADLLAKVDGAARAERRTRSGIIDAWLRRAARERAERSLSEEIAAYYDGLTGEQQSEDEAWARASSASFFRREAREPTRSGRGRRS